MRLPIIIKTVPVLSTILFMLMSSNAMSMIEMADTQLSEVTGQALLQMDKQAGTGVSSNVVFYKAGLDAEVEINMNIEKLQLGCTAASVNGQFCDIDIDKFSLSGKTWTNGRPDSAAILTRPFFEFAIKNDQSKTLREVVGIRLSAENANGMLTFGDQTAAMTPAQSKNGINSLSGYMSLGSATGTAVTEERPMSYSNTTYGGKNYTGLGQAMTGNLRLTVLGITDVVGISSTDYNLILQSTNAYVTTNPTVVSGKRLTSVQLDGTATIDPVNFAGPMAANVNNVFNTGLNLNLDKDVDGVLTGLGANVDINESLAFIHKIETDNPFSLSMQMQDVLWPDAAVASQKGWWLAFEDQIDIGNISPEAPVELTNAVLLQTLNGATGNAGTGTTCTTPSVNCALFRQLGSYNGQPYGIRCDGLNECLGGSLSVGNVSVPLNVDFPLTDLKLGAQSVVPNCWGTARFC